MPAARAGSSTSAPSTPGGVDQRLAAVQAQLAREPLDGVVRDGEDDQLDLVEDRRRLGEGARARHQAAEALTPGRVARCDGHDRPAGAVQRRAERRPDRARAPMIPTQRRLARLRTRRCGMGVRADRRRCACAASGSRGSTRGTIPRVESIQRRGSPACHVLIHSEPAPRSARACRTTGGSAALGDAIDLERAPVTLKILLENALRHAGGGLIDAGGRARPSPSWRPGPTTEAEIPFMPSRVLLQDFTGVPAIVDLAAMRDAMAELGGDPARVNPLVPADLVIDHSVQVDQFGTPGGVRLQRRPRVRAQRRALPAAALGADGVPRPARRAAGTGIVHQVNLEYLATVVADRDDEDGRRSRFPDTVVGTDSHTTMVNGLGVLAWGVGGIEAEAALLGQPIYMPMPRVVGVRLSGELPRGSTATDLVLVVTQMLRGFGVVGAFVEFAGRRPREPRRSPTGRRSPT